MCCLSPRITLKGSAGRFQRCARPTLTPRCAADGHRSRADKTITKSANVGCIYRIAQHGPGAVAMDTERDIPTDAGTNGGVADSLDEAKAAFRAAGERGCTGCK